MKIEEVLKHKLVNEPLRVRRGEYSFYLGTLTRTRVTVRLEPDRDKVRFVQSHYIHTPVQIGPYVTTHPVYATEAIALRQAIETLTTYYEYAVAQGHEPSESWLVPNVFF